MAYFVTGATGFIGRFLVEELLRNREGEIFVLVRQGSRERLDALIEQWPEGARERVVPVLGSLESPMLGVDTAWIHEHRGKIERLFHLAALYDMTADDERNEQLNVDGTKQVLRLAHELDESGSLTVHHTSSVAAAGAHKGLFREDQFDVGQKLPSAYHKTKFDSEKLVRESGLTFRVYRPAIVVGHSQTGEMDKVDGPYYFFKAIQRVRGMLPEWMPLLGVELGRTNIVPVDFVARAMDHIAHQPDLDGQAFHLVAPTSQRSGDVLNSFAKAAHAPRFAARVDKRMIDAMPKGILSMLMKIPQVQGVRDSILLDWGIPAEVMAHTSFSCQFDKRDTERALAGTDIAVPDLDDYAWRLWDHWERYLDPDLFKDHSLGGAVGGRQIVVTGASAGIGRDASLKLAAAGAEVILVSRSRDKLEAVQREIEEAGGIAHVEPGDLGDVEAIGDLAARLVEKYEVWGLVNNAGRSIRRGVKLSYDRFHDFERTMQLNYFGTIKLIMGLAPAMEKNGGGHVVNVSSIGVQTSPPRFSAYVASKAALDAWTRVVAAELLGDGITFTTIHMPLVKTAMTAPTKIYESFPMLEPGDAADLICEGFRAKPKQINTKLGTAGEVLYALAPKVSDQILHVAYKVFQDSAASKGQKDPKEHASVEQVALASLMKGVHW